jgi:NADH dehydrogenase
MSGKQQKVVILGGGFAGLVTARHLVKAGVVGKLCEVTIIDATDAHVYTPWLYEAATGALRGETKATKDKMINTAAFKYRDLPGFKNIRFVQKRIETVDLVAKHVMVEGKRSIPYDVLVVALGAEPHYFGVPGLPENALVLKKLADAQKIHDAVVKLIDKARAGEPKYILIAGAGPNGVEFVSELANTVRVLERHQRLEPGALKITLADPAPELFTILAPSLRKKAVKRLEMLGVELRPGLRVAEVDKGYVKAFTVSGKNQDTLRLPADLCIWSAGVKVNSLASTLPFLKDDRGRIVLENTYMVASHPGVFAAGDCAALVNPHTGKSDPQSAQVAHYQAHDVSKNIIRYLQGRPLKIAHLPKRWAFFSALGGAYAAGTVGGVQYWGYPAFIWRRISDLYYFLFLLPPVTAIKFWLAGVRLYHKNDR